MINAQDLHVLHIDPKGVAAPMVTYHRVWDKQLFLNETQARYTRAAQSEPDDFRRVSVATESDIKLCK